MSLVYSLLLSAKLNVGLPRIPPLPFDEAAQLDRSIDFKRKKTQVPISEDARFKRFHGEFHARKLRVGYYFEEYTFPKPCPAVRRVLQEALGLMSARGHELVDFRPHSDGTLPREMLWDADTSFYISSRPYSAEKKQEGIKVEVPAGEPVHPDLQGMFGALALLTACYG